MACSSAAHQDLKDALEKEKSEYEKGLKEQADRYQQLAKESANIAQNEKQDALYQGELFSYQRFFNPQKL